MMLKQTTPSPTKAPVDWLKQTCSDKTQYGNTWVIKKIKTRYSKMGENGMKHIKACPVACNKYAPICRKEETMDFKECEGV